MPLMFADNLLYYARNYRVCYLGGRFGGGKTSICFRMAYELKKKFKMRYILSNVNSVWNDDPEDVQLDVVRRNGRVIGATADAIIILDEGGEFLDSASQAKKWLSMLRKLNIILLIPSVTEPARLLRRFSVMRTMNLNAIGLPFWVYQLDLLVGRGVTEKERFIWNQPSEIFGIYDTAGTPTDADEILDYVRKWTAQSAKELGYDRTSEKLNRESSPITFNFNPESELSIEPQPDHEGQLTEILRSASDEMEELRWLVEDAKETKEEQDRLVSVSRSRHRKRRR